MIELTVQELFHRVQLIQFRTSKLVGQLTGGAWRSVFKGRGIEFDEVREYRSGDDTRHIDWKVTARMNRPYVREFVEERQLSIMLVVDISSSCQFGKKRPKSHYIAELAAVFALSATKNNDRVGLILFSDHVEKYLPPKRGPRHVLRVIREILGHQAENEGTDIREALVYLEKVQKKADVCILLSDFLTDLVPEKELGATAKRHDLIALSVADPMEETLPNLGLARMRDLETGEEVLLDTACPEVQKAYEEKREETKESFKHHIQKAGGSFLTFQTDKPYNNILHNYFFQRGRRY